MSALDTNVLVAYLIREHPDREAVRGQIVALLEEGERFVITHGVLAELLHVVTDPRRFKRPLSIGEGVEGAEVDVLGGEWWMGEAGSALSVCGFFGGTAGEVRYRRDDDVATFSSGTRMKGWSDSFD